jgi:hypothetical protein
MKRSSVGSDSDLRLVNTRRQLMSPDAVAAFHNIRVDLPLILQIEVIFLQLSRVLPFNDSHSTQQ